MWNMLCTSLWQAIGECMKFLRVLVIFSTILAAACDHELNQIKRSDPTSSIKSETIPSNIDWTIPDTPESGGNPDFCNGELSQNYDDGDFENFKGCTAVAIFKGKKVGDILKRIESQKKVLELTKQFASQRSMKVHLVTEFKRSSHDQCLYNPRDLTCETGLAVWFASGPGYSNFIRDLNAELEKSEGQYSLEFLVRPVWNVNFQGYLEHCGRYGMFGFLNGDPLGSTYNTEEANSLAVSHIAILKEFDARKKASLSDGMKYLLKNIPRTTAFRTDHYSYLPESERWAEAFDFLTSDPSGYLFVAVEVEPKAPVYAGDFETRIPLKNVVAENTNLIVGNRCVSRFLSPHHMTASGVFRNDQDGKLMMIFQNEALGRDRNRKPVGSPICPAGTHLPGVREMVDFAVAHGAKGTLPYREGQLAPSGYTTVIDLLPDGTKDSFYYSRDGYVAPAGELGSGWWLTSSLGHSGYSTYGFYADTGRIYGTDDLNDAGAVRCLKD